MFLDALGRSLDTRVFPSHSKRAFDNRRIRSNHEIETLVRATRCRLLVFRPLRDTQNIDTLLADHPNSSAIWIYRQYQDVANSIVRKWGRNQHKIIRQMTTNEDWADWRVERMTNQRRQFVKKHYRAEISDHSIAALTWYLRNQFYFDYDLDKQSHRVRLVRYEDLVRDPVTQFQGVFDFLGLKFKSSYVSHVHDGFIQRDQFPTIDSALEQLCQQLMDRLNSALETQSREVLDI